jgi:thioredoxin-dependent peroxiredoxin
MSPLRFILLFLSSLLLPVGTVASELKPGDPAPLFALQGSDGQVHRLSDYVGKKMVVLAWFPKAFTGG